MVIALLALGLSIGLTVAAFFVWNHLQQVTERQSDTAMQIDQHLQPVRSSLRQLEERVETAGKMAGQRFQASEQRREKLAANQQDIEERLSVLAALVGRSDEGWTLAEVEYLLGVASKQLQLRGDVKTARVALQSADALLRERSDPHYRTVREQIEEDLEVLARLPVVDVDGISIRLDAWTDRIDKLPVAGTVYQPPEQTDYSGVDMPDTAADWKQVPGLVWNLVKELFRFREHDKAVKPMLAPEREYFLRENLKLQLSAAKLALLRDNGAQYHAALRISREWLKEYFSMEEPSVREAHGRLGELLEIEVSPELPDISNSLRVLRQQMKLESLDANPTPGAEGATS
ncbi:MAG: uroporphyrinogen-III C-methyltransferase [Thiogranum sp.]|nr:uroporphyrinogen-III C-methyltransferase [Thiogranum sp.]